MAESDPSADFLEHLLLNPTFPETTWSNSVARQAAIAMQWVDLSSRRKEAHPLKNDPEEKRRAGSGNDEIRTVDVLIICPLQTELQSGLIAFGRQPDDEDDNVEGCKVVFVNLPRSKGPPLSVAISVVTKPRNAPCTAITTNFIHYFDPKIVILSGIAGGVKGKVDLGDVIIASGVWDTMGARVEAQGELPRPRHFEPPNPIGRLPGYLRWKPKEWRVEVLQAIAELRKAELFDLADQSSLDAAAYKFGDGAIVAGEKLIADGSLPALRVSLDEEIRACDMEGSGFAEACHTAGRQWLMFRGISDYGDPDKDKKWQGVAALHAMLVVVKFLKEQLRLPSEMRKFR